VHEPWEALFRALFWSYHNIFTHFVLWIIVLFSFDCSIYLLLSRGAIVSHFKEVWRAWVLPRVRVFLWQLIRGKLSCSEQVAKRLSPSNGECALCGALEDCNHIFFSCSLARFVWAGVREVLQCSWNPVGVRDFLIICRGLSGPLRRLVWFTFAGALDSSQ
jgi:hypothetical protein